MSYIGNIPTTAAFVTDTFSANGSGTVFTLSVAPANTSSILVAVSGVLQDPSTYSVAATTLTFSAAPPAGTGNISVRFLGIPASGVTTTAYRTVTEFTATAGQTTFSVPSYTSGYINVYRNGAMLGTADYTATNGTTVVLAAGASVGDLVATESFYVSSVLNAIPATAGAVTSAYLLDGSVTQAKLATNVAGNGPAFSAYMSAATPVANATWTKLRFNTELFDTNSNFDTTNYRFLPTVAGYYQINAIWRNGSNFSANYVITRLYKNGNPDVQGSWLTTTTLSAPTVNAVIYFNGTTDYVEAYAYQNSGSSNDTDYDYLYLFNGALVRAA
jgi:hypothetical protein